MSPIDFVTGFRLRPVRIVATSLEPTSLDFVPNLELIARVSVHVAALEHSIDACTRSGSRCELRVEVKDWTELFALGTLMAVESDPDWILEPGGATADNLARRAVQPFRDNWLHTSGDAAVLNTVEVELARAYGLNQLRKFTEHYTMTYRSIAAHARADAKATPIRVQDHKIFLTGNAPALIQDEFQNAMESSFPPRLIERMQTPLIFKTLSNEDREQLERLHVGCREDLVDDGPDVI